MIGVGNRRGVGAPWKGDGARKGIEVGFQLLRQDMEWATCGEQAQFAKLMGRLNAGLDSNSRHSANFSDM